MIQRIARICYCNHSNPLVVYASFIELYKNGNYVTGYELISEAELPRQADLKVRKHNDAAH